MGVTAGGLPDADWTPVRVHRRNGGLVVDWAHLAGVAPTDPFFDQTLQGALRHPFRLLFRRECPAEALAELAGPASGGLPVAGVIHHVSRCGSTLVAHALGSLPPVLALSEPDPLDTVLRAPADALGWSAGDHAAVVRGMIAALSRGLSAGQAACVVKADSWAIAARSVLRAALPGVPWVCLTRDPVEVLASQVGHRSYHTVPGGLPPAVLGGGTAPVEADAYAAWVLGRLADLAADAIHVEAGAGIVVDHAELPGAIAGRIAPHFGLTVDAAGAAAIATVTGRDAKNPVLPYVDDRAAKQGAAPAALRADAERWMRPAFDRLAAGGVAIGRRAGSETVGTW
jgi:hypothetical protein